MKKLIGYQRGINLGGWLSQGPLDKEHLDTFITEPDIERIASWGLDHVRLPLDFENIEHDDGTEKPEGYVYIDNCISWCRKYGLNMVLDLHKTCGYIFDNDEYSADFFDSDELQDRFVNLWKRLSARYAKDSDIVMFELLNEVNRFEVADKWNEIILRTLKEIRKNAPTAKLMYGGVCANSAKTVKLLCEPIDENIVYNFHCYEPLIFTHQGGYWVKQMPVDYRVDYPEKWEKYISDKNRIGNPDLVPDVENLTDYTMSKDFFIAFFKDAIKTAEERNVPLYCGEYGVIELADPEAALRWYQDIHAAFEEYGIGRATWSYKKMDFGIIDEHYNGVRDEIIKNL